LILLSLYLLPLLHFFSQHYPEVTPAASGKQNTDVTQASLTSYYKYTWTSRQAGTMSAEPEHVESKVKVKANLQ